MTIHRLIRRHIFLHGIRHPSQDLRPYPLLACRTHPAPELDTPLQGAQHKIVDAEKHPDIEQGQCEQGGIIAVGDEVVIPQPIHEPQQRHMDK
jgi:hypothetical protein